MRLTGADGTKTFDVINGVESYKFDWRVLFSSFSVCQYPLADKKEKFGCMEEGVRERGAVGVAFEQVHLSWKKLAN